MTKTPLSASALQARMEALQEQVTALDRTVGALIVFLYRVGITGEEDFGRYITKYREEGNP